MLELFDARAERVHVRLERPALARGAAVESETRAIIDDVRLRGDAAVLEYTSRFDGARLEPDRLRVEPDALAAARHAAPRAVIAALEQAASTYKHDHARVVPQSWSEKDAGRVVGELVVPLRRAGIYVSRSRSRDPVAVLGPVLAAQVAGVEGIAVCSPPQPSGEIAELTLAACSALGVDEVYRIGGAQAIAALAYGTSSVRPVDKVVGSGGPFTACAQRSVRGWVGTGPQSGAAELMIVADSSASPRLIAADLAGNASQGAGGTHILIATAEELFEDVVVALDAELAQGDTGDVENALIEGGRAVLVRDLDQALETANAFAPQFLMLALAQPEEALAQVRRAGSVVLGQEVPVASLPWLGGSGEVAPSGGTARWDSALSPRDFLTVIPIAGGETAALAALAGTLEPVAGSHSARRALQLRFGG